MKTLEKILIAILVVLFLLVIIAFLLPSKWSVSRSIVIEAPISAIHPHIDNLKKWNEWAPWTTDLDPTLKYVYSGPESGEGAMESWEGQKVGSGSLTITRSDPETGITYTLSFSGEHNPSEGTISYEKTNGETLVT